MNKEKFPLVSVCIITFNRIATLKKTVDSLLLFSSYPRSRMELILCDDGSPQEVQEEMRKLPFDRYLFAKKNEGLGRNSNKGILAASGDFILQLQDDWVLTAESDFIQVAIEVMSTHSDIFMVRYRKLQGDSAFETRYTNNGLTIFVMVDEKEKLKENLGLSAYTDNPHLKRKELHQLLGLYKEGVPMTKMETDFIWRFASQDRLKVAYILDYEVFNHIGSDLSFNPSQKKGVLRAKLLGNVYLRYPFKVYLYLKHSVLKPLFTRVFRGN